MSAAHRQVPTSPIRAVLLAAASAAAGAVIAAAAGPPTGTVAPPAVEPVRVTAVHEMTVYDDDPARGADRCEAWSNPYAPGSATCTVRSVADAPHRGRARDGAAAWDRRFGDHSNDK